MPASGFEYSLLLERNAARHGARLAVADGQARWSHAELNRRSRVLACWLALRGVERGDRVALLANNCAEWFAVLGAAALRGAVVVALNTRAGADETAHILEEARPRLVLAETSLEGLLASSPATLPCHGIDAATARLAPFDVFSGDTRADGPALPGPASAPLLAVPTAAVGGRPRLALLSHAGLMAEALQLGYAWQLRPGDVALGLLPLHHLAGLGIAIAVQLQGGANVLMPRFDPALAARLIAQERATCFGSFAPMLGRLLDAAEEDGADLASVRAVTGLEPEGVWRRLQARWPGAVFWSTYGQTETAGPLTLAPAADRTGSSGLPLPLVAMRIEGEAGQPQPCGEAGQIVVLSPTIFSGYMDEIPATEDPGTDDGWHRTGDLGRLDADGYLYFIGRTEGKALIKSGGENVYPAEVEQALLAHPDVAECVVFGVPDLEWGERVAAVCVMRSVAGFPPAMLGDFVADRIAAFKRPRQIDFVERLPRHADGSVDRVAASRLGNSHAGR